MNKAILAGLTLLPSILVIVGASMILKKVQTKRNNEVLEKFKDKKLLGASGSVNFFGLESRRASQVKGNGVLAVTAEELYFKMWKPAQELSIPVSSIIKVETTKSFLGKTKFVPFLKVVFKNRAGETDSAAWLLRNVDNWKINLDKLIQSKK